MKIKIVNNRTEGDLQLLLTGDSITGLTGIDSAVSTKLSDFKKSNPNMEIDMTTISGGRLYIGRGPFPGAPLPEGDQYYGWIEFTKKSSETVVWVNLSNVDITGLPLALAGTDSDGNAFTLGYKKSIMKIIADMLNDALVPAKTSNAAYVTCATGEPKIVGPNSLPDSFNSYASYISELNTNKAPLSITSDTPDGGSPKTFVGSFMNSSKDSDVMISMKAADGTTFEVLQGQFNTEICYRCDGGTLIYNGQTVDQNQTPQTTDAQLYSNSTFRNILIGINEGYFTKDGPNNSEAYGGQVPFATGDGSKYAQVLHENSNSYGFPYADSNLKVLVTADPSATLTLTICKDDQAIGYDGSTETSSNQPTSGDYQFGIGENSADLGMITIGNWRYLATDKGAYGGYLPSLTEWTKMHFHGPGKYIWIKTTGAGDVSADGCFNTGAPAFSDKKVLTWGANVAWVAGVDSPAKPTS